MLLGSGVPAEKQFPQHFVVRNRAMELVRCPSRLGPVALVFQDAEDRTRAKVTDYWRRYCRVRHCGTKPRDA